MGKVNFECRSIIITNWTQTLLLIHILIELPPVERVPLKQLMASLFIVPAESRII